MRKLMLIVLFAIAAAAPAMSADTYSLVKDTVGNCSAVVTSVHYPGQKIVSNRKYSTIEEANKALDDLKDCSGLVR